jgi:calcium binding protein 39
MSLFRLKPSKIVVKATNAITAFVTNADGKRDESLATINKNFTRMTDILYKRKEGDETSSRAVQLVTDVSKGDFIPIGFGALQILPVEQRKQFTNIFTGSVTLAVNGGFPVAAWVAAHPAWLDQLLGFYDFPELAVCTGEMLRICTKYEPLAQILQAPERLDRLFSHFTEAHFDVSADSFATFRELILNAPQADVFLRENRQPIVDRLHATLVETNYAPCRQTLKLLGEIIMTFDDFQDRYLTDEKNLIIMMKLMVSTYKNISMEAFHIFKLFVAKEEKPEPILKILRNNSQKLVQFLGNLLDGIEDREIQQEKDFLIGELGALSPPRS